MQGFILMPENYKSDFLKSRLEADWAAAICGSWHVLACPVSGFTSHAKLPSLRVDADEDTEMLHRAEQNGKRLLINATSL